MNKARIASSNKTGLVYKISFALVVLLGLLLYKLNDYFRNDKTYAMQNQIRSRVVAVKTSVSGQLAQLKNTLSSFESEISDNNINWVQLDPFFAIARVENSAGQLRVKQIVARSNTPAERWNINYLEKALSINKSQEKSDILVQLFKDRNNSKFILIRFVMGSNRELVVASSADYFQKYFDIERGSRHKSLLITSENIVAAHTEGDYIANSSKEAALSAKTYLLEKEEIVGTNLVAVSYILKKKIISGFAVPWSIIGVVLGFGFILIGVLYYGLEPIERRVERYRKQEREQIYKDVVKDTTATLSGSSSTKLSSSAPNPFNSAPTIQKVPIDLIAEKQTAAMSLPPIPTSQPESAPESSAVKSVELINLLERDTPLRSEMPVPTPTPPPIEIITPVEEVSILDADTKIDFSLHDEKTFVLDEEKIDLDDIEKALKLDDLEDEKSVPNANAKALEENLKPQKISVSITGAPIAKPQFVLERKDFKVDEFKVNVRKPQRI